MRNEKDFDLTIKILQEVLKTIEILNTKLEEVVREKPSIAEDKECWTTINEYLLDQGLSFYDKSKRTSLGLKLKKQMDIKGLKPLKIGKSNLYPKNMIRDVLR